MARRNRKDLVCPVCRENGWGRLGYPPGTNNHRRELVGAVDTWVCGCCNNPTAAVRVRRMSASRRAAAATALAKLRAHTT